VWWLGLLLENSSNPGLNLSGNLKRGNNLQTGILNATNSIYPVTNTSSLMGP
jgi:hypothetical protein